MAKRALSTAMLVAAFAFPATAGHAADRAPAPLAEDEFAASFAAMDVAPALGAADGAVDMSSISPAVEEPGSGRQIGSGVASYYADKFNGRRTASGEAFSNSAMTAAHRSLPFGTRLRVTNPANGASVIVRINDRGPFHAGRSLDVSRAAASRLGLVARGSGLVEMAVLD